MSGNYMKIIKIKESFDEVKNSIELALEEIKKQSPELYLHLKDSIKINEANNTFCYSTKVESINQPVTDECQHESDGQKYASEFPWTSENLNYKCKKCGEFYR